MCLSGQLKKAFPCRDWRGTSFIGSLQQRQVSDLRFYGLVDVTLRRENFDGSPIELFEQQPLLNPAQPSGCGEKVGPSVQIFE